MVAASVLGIVVHCTARLPRSKVDPSSDVMFRDWRAAGLTEPRMARMKRLFVAGKPYPAPAVICKVTRSVDGLAIGVKSKPEERTLAEVVPLACILNKRTPPDPSKPVNPNVGGV